MVYGIAFTSLAPFLDVSGRRTGRVGLQGNEISRQTLMASFGAGAPLGPKIAVSNFGSQQKFRANYG